MKKLFRFSEQTNFVTRGALEVKVNGKKPIEIHDIEGKTKAEVNKLVNKKIKEVENVVDR